MTENKYILFIVEGNSDHAFYGEYFNELISNHNLGLEIKVTGGDILTKKATNPVNLVKNAIHEEIKKSKLQVTDFVQVIQICDIDGSFFSEEQFKVDDRKEYYDKTYLYSPFGEPKIYVRDEESKVLLLNRWKTKRNNQIILSNQNSINMGSNITLPYSLFYVSLFLEHLLKNDPLIDPLDKRDCIEDYLDSNSIDDFIRLLHSRKYSDDFKNSWEILEQKKGVYTSSSNLNILVEDLQKNKIFNN
ncbi:hypothetical protein [Lactococcus garvieae]|uniref:hypothetical protein n=1 Tax=Lactococcus garvieae TaxID=1363 RepID=UPI00254A7B11|nr:hypothetical protein [Lactococcus garvieae]